MIISLTFCLAQIIEFCSLVPDLNWTNAQKALLQCTLATELGCFFKVVLKEASITQSYGCRLMRKNHRVILQCSIPLGGIFSSVVAFKAAIKAI